MRLVGGLGGFWDQGIDANPKTGTVTFDVKIAVGDRRQSRISGR
jgi:hypothetical protein